MLVPKLRFKEFEENWKELNLKDVSDRVTRKNINNETNLPLTISSLDGLVDQRIYFNKSIASKDMSSYYLLKKGEFAYNKSYSAGFNYGSIKRLDNYDKGALSTLYICFKLKKIINSDFIYKYFDSQKWNREVYKICTEGARNHGLLNISPEDFFDIKLKLPDIREQEKIALFLNLLDKKIELQQRKIEVLKMYKRGLINKLYTSLDCSEVQIKDIGEVITGTTPSKDNLSYWSNGTIVWVTPSDITEFKNISDSQIHLTPQGLNAGRKLPKNTLLITCIASIGKNAVLKVAGSCNQQINAIIPYSGYDIDFLYYLFEYKKLYMQSIAGTSATSIINKSSFEKILLKIPNISVQKNIAKNLSTIDYKIEIQQHLLDRLIAFKKSLLQQMFI